jgi:hypothetical protein
MRWKGNGRDAVANSKSGESKVRRARAVKRMAGKQAEIRFPGSRYQE